MEEPIRVANDTAINVKWVINLPKSQQTIAGSVMAIECAVNHRASHLRALDL